VHHLIGPCNVQVTKKAAHIGGFFVLNDVAKLTLYATLFDSLCQGLL
jgi:hypothetical protein